MSRGAHPGLTVMAAVEWHLSRGGQERARELMSVNQYAGPIPVAIDVYSAVARAQASDRPRIGEAAVREALNDLVLADDVVEGLGAALNGDRPLFLYGALGNGGNVARATVTVSAPPVSTPPG